MPGLQIQPLVGAHMRKKPIDVSFSHRYFSPTLSLPSPLSKNKKSFRFLRLYLFIFRQREREGEREGEKHQCVVASLVPPTGDLAHNPGMCPDREWNRQLFGSEAGA